MDYLTLVVALGLMALGGVIVYWPMSLILQQKAREVRDLQEFAEDARGLVEEERKINYARDLDPAGELRVLLPDPPDEESEAS